MIYLYGQVMSTESFVLKRNFPEADGYGEITEKHHTIGGETGTAAAILAGFGCRVKVGGTHIGNLNRDIIRGYLSQNGIDGTELADEDFDGVTDRVFISGSTRTCFGEWEKLYGREKPFYEPPREESVRDCTVMGWDGFCGEEAARLCRKYGKKLAAIDCRHDSAVNKVCEVNVISHEFLRWNYLDMPDMSPEQALKLYTDNTDGLVIFTFGSEPVLYGRKGQPPRSFPAYRVTPVSTLGAGDSFKAGTIYALSQGLPDEDIVRYGCAVAAAAICKYPISEKLPTLKEVRYKR